ncbi:MAG: hypothetical protein QW184_01375 [Nanopusillaceae archaeon]
MRSQEQLISYILLGVIIMGISIGVYNYVVPMIQKSYVRNFVTSLEKNLMDLADLISSTGLRYGRATYTLEAPGAKLEIVPDVLKIGIKSTIQYYTSYIRVPINYNEPVVCYNNSFPIIIGSRYFLCSDDNKIEIYILNEKNMIINDYSSNNSIIIPIRDHKDIITSLFVFDVVYNGTHIIFLAKKPTGYYKISQPCILNVYQIYENIYYEITCRPLVDISTRQCYWIRILPYQRSSMTLENKVTISISYNYYNDVIIYSTICDRVRFIDLYLSLG